MPEDGKPEETQPGAEDTKPTETPGETPKETETPPPSPPEPVDEIDVINQYRWNERDPSITDFGSFDRSYRGLERAHQKLKDDYFPIKEVMKEFQYSNPGDFAEFLRKAQGEKPPDVYGVGDQMRRDPRLWNEEAGQPTPEGQRLAVESLSKDMSRHMGIDKIDGRLERLELNADWREFQRETNEAGEPVNKVWAMRREDLDQQLVDVPQLKKGSNPYTNAARFYVAMNPGAIQAGMKMAAEKEIKTVTERRRIRPAETPTKPPPKTEKSKTMDPTWTKEEMIAEVERVAKKDGLDF